MVRLACHAHTSDDSPGQDAVHDKKQVILVVEDASVQSTDNAGGRCGQRCCHSHCVHMRQVSLAGEGTSEHTPLLARRLTPFVTASVEPALNPYQPTHKINVPSAAMSAL